MSCCQLNLPAVAVIYSPNLAVPILPCCYVRGFTFACAGKLCTMSPGFFLINRKTLARWFHFLCLQFYKHINSKVVIHHCLVQLGSPSSSLSSVDFVLQRSSLRFDRRLQKRARLTPASVVCSSQVTHGCHTTQNLSGERADFTQIGRVCSLSAEAFTLGFITAEETRAASTTTSHRSYRQIETQTLVSTANS